MAAIARAELVSERAFEVRSRGHYNALKFAPGAKYVPKERGGPAWRFPLELPVARELRRRVGKAAWRPSDGLTKWARGERDAERDLVEQARAESAELRRLPEVLPDLYRFITDPPPGMPERDYQLADIAFLAGRSGYNFNAAGLGKTIETIAAIYEGGIEEGAHLVSTPVTAIEPVWKAELERWQPLPVLAAAEVEDRTHMLVRAMELHEAGEPFWLVINPDMIRFEAERDEDGEEISAEPVYPELFDIAWKTETYDEAHKMGLGNKKTLGARAARAISAERTYMLTATPIGGKPLRLWSYLNHIEPKRYPSKWRWAECWLKTSHNGFARVIEDEIREGLEEDFYAMRDRHGVRRLKEDVLPQLPPKQYIEVPCRMTKAQARQYKKFARDAEIRIDDQRLTAKGILAEYTRLKQFANSVCVVRTNAKGRQIVIPTEQSGKLPYLLERLDERGIRPRDPEGDAQAIVASESRPMVEMVTEFLNKKGIPAAAPGLLKPGERTKLVEDFQAGQGPRVIVFVTTAGTSLTCDRADSVHLLDETWNPDDDEQLEDRAHRGSRMHQVFVYRYRSIGTIQEYIGAVNERKSFTNKRVLNLRKQHAYAHAPTQGRGKSL